MGPPRRSLLDALRARGQVDCDTLDVDIVRHLQPFEDGTSDVAMAAQAIIDPAYASIVRDAVTLAREVEVEYPETTLESLAAEIFMISLALQVVPYLRGGAHIQVNPFHAYSASRTVADARRITQLCRRVNPAFNTERLIIKVPCTWESMQACAELTRSGTKTQATSIFTMEQIGLAGEAGCRYVAPYILELRKEEDTKYADPAPVVELCVDAQEYYRIYEIPTQVLVSGLATVEDCMKMAGANHMTIPPHIIFQLSEMREPEDRSKYLSVFDERTGTTPRTHFLGNEEAYRLAMTLNSDAEGEIKLCKALNRFCDKQMELQRHIRKYL